MNSIISFNSNWNTNGQSGNWEGQAILYEDGWFEGTVTDTTSPYKGDRLVFGVYLQKEGRIELLKHSPSNISDPFIFRFFNSQGKWEGPFYIITYFGEHKFGYAVLEVTDNGCNLDTENLINEKINIYKPTMDDGLYEKCVNMRHKLIQALKNEMGERNSKQ